MSKTDRIFIRQESTVYPLEKRRQCLHAVICRVFRLHSQCSPEVPSESPSLRIRHNTDPIRFRYTSDSTIPPYLIFIFVPLTSRPFCHLVYKYVSSQLSLTLWTSISLDLSLLLLLTVHTVHRKDKGLYGGRETTRF